jgi:hypothetical protein
MDEAGMNIAVLDKPAPATFLHPGAALPLARYRFTFRMEEELRLPEFAGSLLRGQFGASLRRTACMTGAPVCPGCPLYRTCPYPAIFETPAPEQHAAPAVQPGAQSLCHRAAAARLAAVSASG